MPKDESYLPQELKNDLKRNMAQTEPDRDGNDNGSSIDRPFIIGRGDPNLSPDAGKPII